MSEASMKTVEERKEIARRNGRFRKKEAKNIFQDLITNSDFSYFYHATRFLAEEETPKAVLATDIDEDIGIILITNSNMLFFNKRSNEVSLKEVASFDSVKKFDIFISHGEGEFSIKLEGGTSYRSNPVSADLLKELNTQMSELFINIEKNDEPDENNVEGKDEYIEEANVESESKGGSTNGKNIKEERILEKLSDIEDKIGKKEEWKHKIVTGPVLSGEEKLQSKLNRLGNIGWELVDTQRHSIMGKQKAVCFLKKKK